MKSLLTIALIAVSLSNYALSETIKSYRGLNLEGEDCFLVMKGSIDSGMKVSTDRLSDVKVDYLAYQFPVNGRYQTRTVKNEIGYAKVNTRKNTLSEKMSISWDDEKQQPQSYSYMKSNGIFSPVSETCFLENEL